MKKTAIALALALTLTGALTACGKDRPAEPNGGGSGVSAGQVTRRQETREDRLRDFLDDGRYAAGDSGRVRSWDGNSAARDLTRDARDLARGAKKGAEDLGRAAGRAGEDLKNGVKDAGQDLKQGMEQAAKQ